MARRLAASKGTRGVDDGFRSGSLVVIDGAPRLVRGSRGRRMVDCRVLCFCEACETVALVKAYRVRLRLQRTCGCWKSATKDTAGMNPMFELLQDMGHKERGRQRHRFWRVKCKRCGSVKEQPSTVLKKGAVCSVCRCMVPYQGRLMRTQDIAKQNGIHPSNLLRYLRRGISVESAVKKVSENLAAQAPRILDLHGKKVHATQLAKKLGMSRDTLWRNYLNGARTVDDLTRNRRPPPVKVGSRYDDYEVVGVLANKSYDVLCHMCGTTERIRRRDILKRGRCGRCSRINKIATKVSVGGKLIPLPEALRLFEIKEGTYWSRVGKGGMSPEEALTAPINTTRSTNSAGRQKKVGND